MSKTIKIILRIILFLIPFVLGSVGLCLAGEQVLDALFHAFNMYFMGYSGEAYNLLVEVARWMAPVITFGSVALALTAFRRWIYDFYRYHKGELIAVYGDTGEIAAFAENLPGSLTYLSEEKDRVPVASKYVLLNSEEKNLAYYTAHKDRFGKKPVYLRCESLKSQETISDRMTLFCMEETGARLFWNQAKLFVLSERSARLQVVLIGFGKLGEELVLNGLQNNIFRPDQLIEYHILNSCPGESAQFFSKYHQLHQMGDRVIFHDNSWMESAKLIGEADRVIVCQQQGQLNLLQELLFVINEQKYDVFAADVDALSLIEKQERIHIFDWKRIVLQPENLFGDSLFHMAKAINSRYSNLYNGVEETWKNAEREWRKLDSFTKYSNISSADYHSIMRQMLEAKGYPLKYELLPEDVKELLSELEHERWCRYHYLNNWQYGVPANGKNKDAARKIHQALIPYNKLTREEQLKDLENIRVLLGIHV